VLLQGCDEGTFGGVRYCRVSERVPTVSAVTPHRRLDIGVQRRIRTVRFMPARESAMQMERST
jgi:hypothetical protein